MPEGFELGRAFITVDPDAGDFNKKLDAELAKDNIEVKVKIVPDTVNFKDRLKSDLDKDRGEDVKVRVVPDNTNFKSRMTADLDKDRGEAVKVKVDPDSRDFKSKMTADLARDRAKDVSVKVTPDDKDYKLRVAELTRHRDMTVTVKANKSQVDQAGGAAGGFFSKAFGSAVGGAGSGGGGIGGAAGAGGGGGGPLGGILGGSLLTVGIAEALASLPAAMSALGALAGAGLGTALVLELDKNNKQVKSGLTDLTSSLKDTLTQAIAPMVGPVVAGLKQVSSWVISLKPLLTDLFKTSGQYLMPFLKGIEALVTNFLPGFNAMIHAAAPAVAVFASALGQIGTIFSQVFRDLIPGIAGSTKAFQGLITFLGELLTTIAKVASSLATGSGAVLGKFFITLGNVIGKILLGVMPLLNAAFNALLPPIMHLAEALMPLVGILGNVLASAIKALAPLLMSLVKALDPIIPVLGQIVAVVGKVIVDALTPLIKVITPLLPLVGKLVAVIGSALLSAVKMLSPILVELGAIIGQVAAEVLPPLLTMLNKMLPPVLSLATAMLRAWLPAIQQLIPPISQLIKNLQPVIDELTKLLPIVVEVATRIEIDLIKDAIVPAVMWISRIEAAIVSVIAKFIGWAGKLNDWKNVWDVVFGDVKHVWNDIVNTISNGIDNVREHLVHGVQLMRSELLGTWNTIWGDVQHLWGNIESFFDSFWKHIEQGAGNAVSAFTSSWSKIQNAFKGPVNFLIGTVYDNGIKRFWNDIVGAVGLKSLDLPQVPQLAHGGIIPGFNPGVDDQPAMLSKGEAVLNPIATQALGHPAIHALNSLMPGAGNLSGMHGGVLHAAGGWNPISAVSHAVSDVAHAVGGVINKAKDIASIVAAIATGNTTALTNALAKTIGTTAAGPFGELLTAIPKTLIGDLLRQFTAAGGAAGASGPPGGATGNELANGKELFDYLRQNLFGGNAVAAAGAAASIWGESTWNPFAQGTGGRGLIGWTPPTKISDAVFKGGMATQLPAIISFVVSNGDMGVVNQMKGASSVFDAANLWGVGVERFGVNDVHPQGIALATQILAAYSGPGGKPSNPGQGAINAHTAKKFALGGWINEPVVGRGMYTGSQYTIGESGPEYVSSGAHGGGGTNINFYGTQYPNAEQIANLKLEFSKEMGAYGV